MATEDTRSGRVKTTESTVAIVEALQRMDGARITEVAAELGMAKSTAHRHLSTLLDLEYLTKEGDEYHVGLQFLNLGEYARGRKEAYRIIKPKVKQLAEKTAERAQFIVEEHGQGVYVHRATGDNAVHTPNTGIGKRNAIHATAAGKAILSCYERERIGRIIDRRGLPRLTENTITDEDRLFKQLAEIRDRGFSTNNEENIEGIRAVGVPMLYNDGRPIGALSISGPVHRMKGEWFEREIPDLLLGTTSELELNIAYS